MATPTPSAATQPSSASKKTTDHSTPSRLGVASPAPRSIPSPAATRKDQSGKTPTNHHTASSFGSKTLGGTPMVQSLSQTGLTSSSSPGAHNAGFTPSALGLGVDLGSGTPGQLNMSTPLAGGVGMQVTMSDLGLTVSGGGKRNEDEDRRAKLRKILKTIGSRKGRVSREGLDRIARRVGFDTNLDPGEILIAGKRTLVNIHHRDTAVQEVTAKVYLDDSFKELEEYQTPIGGVLLRDLSVPDGILQRSSLDRFALNLDRLARMDRLSTEISCFAAVHGLYKSLDRLHDLEQKALGELRPALSEFKARDEAMRKKSGRPGLHPRRRIGLALDYWSTEESRPQPNGSESAVDVSSANHDAESTPEIFCLRIEAEGCPAAMYPSLRVSDAWLPETFEPPAQDSIAGIPWMDPPPSYVPDASASAQDSMTIDDTQKLPNLRFVAKLDPPVVMPLQTALNIISAVGAQQPQLYGNLPQYHAMLLNIPPQTVQLDIGSSSQAEQTVLAIRNGEEADIRHHYNLDVSKPDFGFKLEQLPFSHPKQLVELLPTLRQWAHAGALVCDAMKIDSTGKTTSTASNGKNDIAGQPGEEMDLNHLLDSSPAAPSSLHIDIELSTSPEPTISIAFSDPDAAAVRSVTFQVLANADIVVNDYEGVEKSGDGKDETAKKLAEALAICGDLGVWIEWLRQRRSS